MARKLVLIFAVFQIFLFASGAYVETYSTKCFRGQCFCDRANTINCTNVGDNGLDILSKISAHIYQDLNYLIIRGARFGDLPNKNIFNGNVHPNLHTIKLIDSGITSFGPLTFSGAPGLIYLSLDGNPLRHVEPKALDGMRLLKSLSLNNIFDADRDNNENILQNIFDSDLSKLENVSLAKNELRFDLNNIVCNLPSLFHLDLSDNRLEAFSLPSNCASPIETLLLHDNDIVDLPSFPRTPIKEITLYNNPLDCDWSPCDYSELLDLVKNKSLRLHSLAEMVSDADCKSSSSIPLILLSLALILIVALAILWWKGGRRTLEFYKESDYDMVQLADNSDTNPNSPTYV